MKYLLAYFQLQQFKHLRCNAQWSTISNIGHGNNVSDDGNEYPSSQIYTNSSRFLAKFNETNYILEISKCQSLKVKIFRCFLNVNTYIGSISRLWVSKYDAKRFRRHPNCKYDWSYDGWDHIPSFIVHIFTIRQHSCDINVTTLQGGTTFEIFAYNSLSTISCSYTDTRKDSYQVQCHMPCVTYKCIEEQRLHTKRHDCIHLTALLSHEHYDSFGEISLTTEEPELRTVLQNNQTYCMEGNRISVVQHQQKHHQHQHQQHHPRTSMTWTTTPLPPGVSVYSGIWVTEPMLNLLSQHHYDHHHHYYHNGSNINIIPGHKSPTIYSNNHTDGDDSSNGNGNYIEKDSDSEIDLYNTNNNNNNNNNTYTTLYAHKKLENLTAISLHTREHQTVFIGASHMRYNFDGIIEHFFGETSLRQIPRKHDFYTIMNFTFIFNLFAGNIADIIEAYCIAPSSNSSMLFVQVGDWDLSSLGFRYTTHNNHPSSPGYRLLNVLNDIFTGKLPCSGINHIVWMTTVPHPLCFSHKDKSECDKARGHRLNANIRALNEFFLRRILTSYGNTSLSSTKTTETITAAKAEATTTTTTTTTTSSTTIGLTVIDVFSIIHPRLIYDENNEVICLNHFSCRYSDQPLAHSPGGAAVVQSILNVMQDSMKISE
eukprot:gene7022-14287_t